jgi:uncharacterized protein
LDTIKFPENNKLIASAISKMACFSTQDMQNMPHDIEHFMKVWAFANMIGRKSGLDERTQQTLDLAAIVHDIACPLCRKKYGNASGKHQEEESEPLVREFFATLEEEGIDVDRIVHLVTHHHTYTDIDGLDYQILLEADFLVNAEESNYSKDTIISARDKFFKTELGIDLINSMLAKFAQTTQVQS